MEKKNSYYNFNFFLIGVLLIIAGCFLQVQEYEISITDYPKYLTEGDVFSISFEIKTEKVISDINNIEYKLKIRESGNDKVLLSEEAKIDNRSQTIDCKYLIIEKIENQLYIEIELYADGKLISSNEDKLKFINTANWHTNIITTEFYIDNIQELEKANEDPEDNDYPAITCWGENLDEINDYYFALPYRPYIRFYNKAVYQNQTDIKNRWIEIFNPQNGKYCYAQWEDLGPWNVYDPFYVFGTNDERPYAELGVDMGWLAKYSEEGARARKTNGAGLDISPAAMTHIGGKGKFEANWRFIEESEVPKGPWTDDISRSQSRVFNYQTRSLKNY